MVVEAKESKALHYPELALEEPSTEISLEVSEAVARRVLYLARQTHQTVDELICTFIEGFPYRES